MSYEATTGRGLGLTREQWELQQLGVWKVYGLGAGIGLLFATLTGRSKLAWAGIGGVALRVLWPFCCVR